jgi:hypothetical protein
MSELRHRILIAVLVAGAAVALFLGVRATDTGDDEPVTSRVVEHFIPGEGDAVIRQAELGIDLAPGYEGALAINGVEIPTEQLRLVPEQNQVFFTPGDGKAVERLRAGLNCVEAEAWRSADGRGTANDRSFTWCFEAL